MSNKQLCKENEKSGKINFKSSRSVLNALKNLFKIPNIPNTTIVDSNLLAFAGGVKPGLSPEKIAARIIQRKSEAGLPVGPLAGGNTAPDEIMEKIRMEEMIKALTEEARIDVCTRPGTQLQATGGNAGGPIQVFGTLISTSCGHGQMF
jgi:hypothetical protein